MNNFLKKYIIRSQREGSIGWPEFSGNLPYQSDEKITLDSVTYPG